MKIKFLAAIATLIIVVAGSSSAATWGSFDGSRASRPLVGSAYLDFKDSILSAGNNISASTSVVDAAYLSTVDVFFAGWLGGASGTLSGAEQTALSNWVTGGGTLILPGDIFNIQAINSVASIFGATFTSVSNGQTVVAPTAVHQLTQGVGSISYNTESTWVNPTGFQTIFENPNGDPFASVADASTGFSGAGQVLFLGDHNILADYGSLEDNKVFYDNIAAWAGQSQVTPVPLPAGLPLILIGIGSLGLMARRNRKAA